MFPFSNNVAAAVLVVTPEGIPLVRDPKKPIPMYWKLPSGKGQGTETDVECAIRELREETGIVADFFDLELLERQNRENHKLSFFLLSLKKMPSLRVVGNEGEEVRVFGLQEVLSMREEMMPNHFLAIRKALKFL